MNIVVPLHLNDAQARTLLRLYEVLIDSLIDFYSALLREYPLADVEPPDNDELEQLLRD